MIQGVNMNNRELFHRIDTMFQSKQFDESYQLGMEIIEKFPEEFEYYRITGISAIQIQEYEQGYLLLEQYHQKYPQDADICFRLAKLLEGFGHVDQSIVFYQRSLRIRPTFLVLFNLGNLYAQRGDVENALQSFKRAYQMNAKTCHFL